MAEVAVSAADSRRIAGVLGPMLAALTASESPWIQPHLYDSQTPPVVYLSGALFLLAGLVLVRNHNVWVARWPVLITILGWSAMLLGLVRMFAAERYPQQTGDNAGGFALLELAGFVAGLFLTYKAYGPRIEGDRG